MTNKRLSQLKLRLRPPNSRPSFEEMHRLIEQKRSTVKYRFGDVIEQVINKHTIRQRRDNELFDNQFLGQYVCECGWEADEFYNTLPDWPWHVTNEIAKLIPELRPTIYPHYTVDNYVNTLIKSKRKHTRTALKNGIKQRY